MQAEVTIDSKGRASKSDQDDLHEENDGDNPQEQDIIAEAGEYVFLHKMN